MDSKRIDISFVPFYKTLTNAGHSHFSRVADALAEFIDNSIQASQRIGESGRRKIELGLDLSFYDLDKDSFISVLDNGEGMDQDCLSKFAVYSLDKESRGLRPPNENASNISKFGVGVKQAGFYLGTSIHVLTSTRGSSDVLELILDKDVLEKKCINKEDVYKGYITSHSLQALRGKQQSCFHFGTDGTYNSRLQGVVNKLFQAKLTALKAEGETLSPPSQTPDEGLNYDSVFASSFTLIVIRLRDNIIRSLRREESFLKLPSQLADIYHFHLHPENLPNSVAQRICDKYGQDSNVENTPPIRPRLSSLSKSRENAEPAPLDISFQIVKDETTAYKKVQLQHLEDLNSRYFNCMRHCFRFNVELPDPNPAKDSSSRQIQSQLVAHEHGERKVVQGLILYFPSENGQETMPSGQLFQYPLEEDGDRQHTTATDSGLASSFVEDLTEEDDDSICRIYWQNRLVPGTKLSKLAFFPEAKTAACEKLHIPLNWRNRIKSFLFFDANFHNISNNKLKINVDPDLQTWITSNAVVKNTLTEPKNLKDSFSRWLKKCYSRFDQEFRYSDPDPVANIGDLQEVLKRVDEMKELKRSPMTVFKNLTVSTPFGSFRISQGDSVRLHLSAQNFKKQAGARSSAGFRSAEIFGEVLGFLSLGDVVPGQIESKGRGLIWYRQVPVEVYGVSTETQQVVNISCLDLKEGKFRVSSDDLKEVRKQAPSFLIVELYHRNNTGKDGLSPSDSTSTSVSTNPGGGLDASKNAFNPDQIKDVSDEEGFQLQVGEPVDITVTVKSGQNELVLHRPNEPNKRYSVRLHYKDRDFGKSSVLYAKKVDKKTSKVTFDSYKNTAKVSKSSQVVHYFNKITFSQSTEEVLLLVDVLDGDFLVLQKQFRVTVSAGVVSTFEIEDSPFFNGTSPVTKPLGSYIPAFALRFYDNGGNLSNHFNRSEARYWVKLTCPEDKMIVEFEERNPSNFVAAYTSSLSNESSPSEIKFLEDSWLPLPLESGGPSQNSGELDVQLLQLLAQSRQSSRSRAWGNCGLIPPLLSSTSVKSKTVTFEVTTSLCPNTQQQFTMTFSPGYPARICLLDLPPASQNSEPQFTVCNGEPIPNITVACFDSFNNRTDPVQGVEWSMRLCEGPIESLVGLTEFPVLKGGTSTLKGLVVNVDQSIPPSGLLVEQTIELIWSLPYKTEISQEAPPSCVVKARVLPGNVPEKLEIIYNEENITSQTTPLLVGTTMSNLSARIIDEKGALWDNKDGYSVYVSVSWWQDATEGKKRKRSKKKRQHHCDLNALTDIVLPTLINRVDNQHVLEYVVTCYVETPVGDKCVEGEFFIELVSDKATSWHISTAGNENGSSNHIRCDNENDLLNLVQGVCAVDQYGNEVLDYVSQCYQDESPSLKHPILFVTWSDDAVTESDNEKYIVPSAIHLHNKEIDGKLDWTSLDHRCEHPYCLALDWADDIKKFVLDSSDEMCSRHRALLPNTIVSKGLSTTSRPFWIHCLDPSRSLLSSNPVTGLVSPGLPRHIRLLNIASVTSSEVTDESFTEEIQDIYFTSKSKLDKLEVVLVDSCGNISNARKLGDCVKNLSLKIEFDPTQEHVGVLGDNEISRSEHVEVLCSKKSFKEALRVPISLDFSKVCRSLELHRVIEEGTLVEILCSASYELSEYNHVNGKKSNRPSSPRVGCRLLSNSGESATVGRERPESQNHECSRSKVSLSPARLICKYQTIDLVTSISAQIVSSNEDRGKKIITSDDAGGTHNCLECGTPFALKVVLVSAECNFVADPAVHDIEWSVRHSIGGGSANNPVEVENMEDIVAAARVNRSGSSASNERFVQFSPITFFKSGKYTFTVTYMESRPHLIEEAKSACLPSRLFKVVSTLELVLVAGPGTRIRPSPFSEENLPPEICATDAASARSEERQLLTDGVDVCLFDRYGNLAEFPSSRQYACVCSVKPKATASSDTTHVEAASRLPRLRSANACGFLKGRCVDQSTYAFSSIELEDHKGKSNSDVQGADGELVLEFSLLPVEAVDSSINASRPELLVSPFQLTFQYISDEASTMARRETMKTLQPLREELRVCVEQIRNKEKNIDEANIELVGLLGQCNDRGLRGYEMVPSELSQNQVDVVKRNFDEYRNEWVAANGDARLRRGIRNAIKATSNELNIDRDFKTLGQVVDLAYVQDEKEAKILSWAAGASGHKSSHGYRENFMAAVVMPPLTAAQSNKLLSMKYSYFSLDRVPNVRRDGVDSSNGVLDLPEICLPGAEGPLSGNPRYMVNMLMIEPGEYDLRASIFYAIFKKNIVIDTNDDAHRLIQSKLKMGEADIPTIYTMEGRCFHGNGLVTPHDNLPRNLDFVFGEPRSEVVSELEGIESDLSVIGNLVPTLDARDKLSSDLRELQERQRRLQSQIDDIEMKFSETQGSDARNGTSRKRKPCVEDDNSHAMKRCRM